MKRNDMILLGMIIILVILGLGSLQGYQSAEESTHRFAVITQNRRLVERIELDNVSESRIIKLGGKYNEIIIVEKGRIKFKEADCPDKICVKTGWLEKPGDTAVCLPNRVVVKIED